MQCGHENYFYFLWPWLLLKVFYLLFISIVFNYEELVLYLKLQKVWVSTNTVYRKMPIFKIPYENYLFVRITSNNLEPRIVGRFPPCFGLLCFGRMFLWSLDWTWTCDLPASASRVLGLETHTSLTGLINFYGNANYSILLLYIAQTSWALIFFKFCIITSCASVCSLGLFK